MVYVRGEKTLNNKEKHTEKKVTHKFSYHPIITVVGLLPECFVQLFLYKMAYYIYT